MANRIKTLAYRRAHFLVEGTGPLEQHLIEAHKRLPNIENRTIGEGNQIVLECRNFSHKPDFGVFLHIAAYTPGEQASVVRRVHGVSSGELETAAAPEGCEFMDGDTMIFVAGDHVLLCSSTLHEKQSERYLTRIVDAAKIATHAGNFELSKVANIDKVKLLKKQGVKSINLNSTLYSASLDHLERTTVSKSLAGGIADQVLAIFGKNMNEKELEKAENISVNLKLSFDSRKAGAAFGKEKLGAIADLMVNEDDNDGFTIETMTGEMVGPNDIILRKKIAMQKFGKTVYCQDAWRELEIYYFELKNGGLLEQ